MQVAVPHLAKVALPVSEPVQTPEQQSAGLPQGLSSTAQAQAPPAQESVAQSPSAWQLAPSARPCWQKGPESIVIRHMCDGQSELDWHWGKRIPQPESSVA